MKKETAIKLFGGKAQTALALDLTPNAIRMWKNELSQRQTDQVIGACFRLGIPIPKGIKNEIRKKGK